MFSSEQIVLSCPRLQSVQTLREPGPFTPYDNIIYDYKKAPIGRSLRVKTAEDYSLWSSHKRRSLKRLRGRSVSERNVDVIVLPWQEHKVKSKSRKKKKAFRVDLPQLKFKHSAKSHSISIYEGSTA